MTPTDEQTKRAILWFNVNHGRPPTALEVAAAMSLESKSTAHKRINRLRDEGWLLADDRRIALSRRALDELALLLDPPRRLV